MNNTRRKKIQTAVSQIQSANAVLSAVLDEEQDAMDNMPENLQESDRYSAMEEAVDALEEAIDALDTAADSLSGILS